MRSVVECQSFYRISYGKMGNQQNGEKIKHVKCEMRMRGKKRPTNGNKRIDCVALHRMVYAFFRIKPSFGIYFHAIQLAHISNDKMWRCNEIKLKRTARLSYNIICHLANSDGRKQRLDSSTIFSLLRSGNGDGNQLKFNRFECNNAVGVRYTIAQEIVKQISNESEIVAMNGN